MLIDRGILAKPYFKIVELKKKPAKLHSITPWQAAYRLGIVQNEERNNAICMEILKAREYGMTAMVLVQHTSHGDTLLDCLTIWVSERDIFAVKIIGRT
ncbi:hypothetical protein [Acinetobacter baumannii]|uniref:hypothetical protein n=1 Tax=Acinetobacter baumannii TaxID=470 RepID=UPI003CFCE453